MNAQTKPLYEFGPFRLDPKEHTLLRAGEAVPLTPKVFDTLLALVESGGQLVEKDELMNRVWPDAIVEERGLTQNIFLLRRVLGEDGAQAKYIETVPKRGYRFVAEINQRPNGQMDLIVQRRTSARLKIEEETDIGNWNVANAATDPSSRESKKRSRKFTIAMAAAALLVVLGAAFYGLIGNRVKPGETAPRIKSIAVLPFKVLNSDDDGYLGIGLADVLITRLGNLKQISVRPTSAILRYRDREFDPVAVGREQQVDAVLEGHVHNLGERIRITVQLISVRDGSPVWAEQFDEKMRDLAAVEDAISRRLVGALALKLDAEEKQRLAKRYTDNTEAYQLYIKGRHFWNKRDEEGLRKAIATFRQAIDLDPTYALAYAGLADCYSFLGSAYFDPLPPKEDMPKAKAAAVRAVELDDTLAEAHSALAFVQGWYDLDWPGAERELKRALELNSNYATAHQRYGWYFLAMGRLDEALAEMKRAQECDPLSPVININIGGFLYYQRRYDQALEQFQKMAEIDPSFSWNPTWTGMAYLEKGDFTRAIAGFQQEKQPWEQGVWGLGVAYARSGKPAAARNILSRFQEFARQRYVSPSAFILIYTALGEKDQAFAWLEKAYEERDFDLGVLKVDPKLDPLRSDPRFTDLLRRVGLPQ
ncbi:MAG: winged helix-turn-helix domain-containing protein [Acidobacteriota bacterium]